MADVVGLIYEDALRSTQAENQRLRTALERIAFITGGIDTPATSNAAHYEAVNALHQQSKNAST